MEKPLFGVIGGSGLYAIDGLEIIEKREVVTPFGQPSAPLMLGRLEGQPVAFLARHGLTHHINPSEVNYRANIYAMKSIGVDHLVSISACGSLREDYAPGQLAVPDQLVDLTHKRARSFFGEGMVAHVGVADPFCPEFSRLLLQALHDVNADVHKGGSLITIEGPRFSTRGESNLYRAWGLSLIGMTTSPEAFLAREAEMCYAVISHVTDYDVWHVTEEPVSAEMVMRTLSQNTTTVQAALKRLVHILTPERTCACGSALANAIMTAREHIPAATQEKLQLLVQKYWKPA